MERLDSSAKNHIRRLSNFGIYGAYDREQWVLVVSGWTGCSVVVSGP